MAAPKSPPAWTAMPTAGRRGAPDWQLAFLEALARTGVVKLAAEAAGVTARGASTRRARDATFAQGWDTAIRAHRAEHAQRLLSAEAERSLVARPSEGGGAVLQRAGQSRWTKAAEEKFLIELTVSGNVSRAAKAAGFTKATAYKQRMKDRHFTAAWDAAIETGKARVQGYLVEAATRAFDPDELPIGEEAPKVSISEAISIAKLPAREAGAAAGVAKGGRGLEGRTYDETGFDTTPITREEWEEARQNIVNRLQRLREMTEEEERATGLCHCCGQALPDAASEA